MAIEAIEDQPLNPAVASRPNGEALAEATPTVSVASSAVLVTDLVERIEELERQQHQLKRDSLLIAGLTTIAAALAIATMLQKQYEPRMEIQAQPIAANRRVVAAQAFLLTDTQGHPRAKLTFE